MIDPNKLYQLQPGQKRRKLALTFGELERDIAGIPEPGMEYNFTRMSRQQYTKTVCNIVLEDPQLPEDTAKELKKLIEVKTTTKSGKRIEVCGNIGKPEDVDGVIANGGDGVGLSRTEVL